MTPSAQDHFMPPGQGNAGLPTILLLISTTSDMTIQSEVDLVEGPKSLEIFFWMFCGHLIGSVGLLQTIFNFQTANDNYDLCCRFIFT